MAWLPGGRRFLTGSPDKNMYLWDIDGTMVRTWSTPRTFDVAVHPQGSKVLVGSKESLHIFTIEGKEEDVYGSSLFRSRAFQQ